MNKKKIKEWCQNIFFLFNEGERGFPLDEFGDGLVEGNKVYGIGNEKIEDIFWDARHVYFALGYVIGQMVDVTDKSIQRDVELIKKLIREKNVFPYLPKEKGA